MKNIIAFITCLLFCSLCLAQKPISLDKSPMDRAYYPDNFAHDRKFAPEKVGDKAFIRVTYSRPAKKEREIFGKLVPYSKVWRLGANESTEIKFYQDVTIQGKKLSAGTYSLFAIPEEKQWTIIFNSDLDSWGAYSYNEANDLLSVSVPNSKAEENIENFTIRCMKGSSDREAILQILWDTTKVELPVQF